MRDKILQSNNCTSSYQRMVVYLGMGLADRLIHQVDLVMGWRSCRCAQLSFRGRREKVRKSRRCFTMTCREEECWVPWYRRYEAVMNEEAVF